MGEPVYITISEAERDLILNAFGGVRKERMAEMVEALQEASLQIRYLHEKFAETGSGNTTLAKIRSALARSTQTQEGE